MRGRCSGSRTANARPRRERLLSARDRDYVCDGNQWTRAELDALRARGQPDVTINYCSRKIDLMCGLERKSSTDPKAFARNPSDEDIKANAATDSLRYIADDNNFPIIRSDVYENIFVEGVGGGELGFEDDGQKAANITITQAPFDRLGGSGIRTSRKLDFSDARYRGIVIWMDRDQAYETRETARGGFDLRHVRHADRQLCRPAARCDLVRQPA